MTLASLTPAVSLFLIPLLIAPSGWSQGTMPAGNGQNALQLKIVGSDGSQVAASSRSSRGFFVQVTDATGVGVSDVAVALRLPDTGATGEFPDGSHSAIVYTDASGNAHVDGIHWNAIAGTATIRVTATKGDEHAGMLLEETLTSAETQAATAPRLGAAPSPSRSNPVAVSSPAAGEDDAAPLATIPADAEGVPLRPALRAASVGPEAPFLRSADHSVSISNDGSGPAYHGHSSMKKWVWIGLAIAAGAGAAYAVSAMSKGGSTAASSSSISIGAPTVSVGHP